MRDPDFVGADPDSKTEKCPAVFRDPITGDFYQQGRVVTDPAILASLGKHISLGEDEAIVWQPANMAHALAEAASGTYEQGREGPGVPTFRELLDGTQRSAVHLEMRDVYDERDPEFAAWRKGEPVGDIEPWAGEWRTWIDTIQSGVSRGVKIRRARVVSEPLSDYVRFEHAVTHLNLRAGEDVRWLPRRQARELLLPGADFWMFDQRLVRFNYNAGDGTPHEDDEYVTDPRIVRQAVAAFEMVWERAIPHEKYNLDHTPPA